MGERIYNDENFINGLVDEYKSNNSEELRREILDAFSPYFKKYASICCGNNSIDLYNKDTITFLRLFMTDDERSSDEKARFAGRKYITFIRKMFNDYTKQDVYDEMMVYFLEALGKYKPMIADHKRTRERISFTHYIQVNLRFKLKALVKAKSRDAMANEYKPYNDLLGRPTKYSVIIHDFENLDLRWIHGETTNYLFRHLTKGERYIIWLRYESNPSGKELTYREVAATLGIHWRTVKVRMDGVRKKLRELIKYN